MKIQINDKYGIGADSNCWFITKRGEMKDKDTGEVKETWTPFKWYNSLEQATYALTDLMVRTSDVSTLLGLAEAIQAASETMHGAVAQIKAGEVMSAQAEQK